MTMPSPHLDDDALSALLDGDPAGADHDSRAHVDGCVSCLERLGSLERAAALVGTPVAPLPAASVDALVGRAVREAGVSDIRAARERRPRRWAPSPALLAAVAAVVVLLLAVPAVLSGGGDKNDRASVALDAEGNENTAAGGATSESADSASDSAFTGDATGRAVAGENLGALSTQDDLRRVLIARLSTATQVAPTSGSGADTPKTATVAAAPVMLPCAKEATNVGGGRLGAETYAAFVAWNGEPAQVFVFQLIEPTAAGARQAYVMRSTGCGVLAELQF